MLKRCLACFAVYSLGAGLLIPGPAWPQDDPGVEEEVLEEEEAYPEEELPEEEALEEAPRRGTRTTRPGTTTTRPDSAPTRPRVQEPTPATPPTARPPQRPGSRGQAGAKMSEGPGTSNVDPGSKPDEAVMFNYNDEPLIDVIQHIAKLTGRNFDVDPNIGATTVTIITHDRLPPELAFEVLESVLNTRGYSLVENLDGHLVQVVPTTDAPQSAKTPLNIDITEGNIPAGYDTFSTHVVPIKYADPSEMMTALEKLGSKSANIDSYLPTNTLIITDTASGLRRMLRFIEVADVPGNDTSMEIFTLEYTRAEMLATQLEQVLLDAGGGDDGGARQGTRTTRPTTRPTRPTTRQQQGAESEVIGSNEEVLRMVPDERLNALIVVATAGMMERVRDLVIRLDSPTPFEQNNMHIYELLNADAEMIEQALQPLIGTAPRRQDGGGGGGSGGGGAAQTAEVQPFEQRVQITRYDQTNSLLIVASPQDYKLLEAYIARLDVPQRQVYVKASVMDVAINNAYNLNVNAASIDGSDAFGLTDTTLLPVTNLAEGLANPQAAGLGLLSSVLSLGDGGGVTAGIFDDITVDIGGRDFDLPFVPLLFQALETISDLEVLSQPSLTTIDNEESSITVGQEVPFITGTSRPQTTGGGELTTSFGTTRVQREDVGVKLTVTPQISEGDNVLLEVEIEVSDIAEIDPRVGTPDIVGPTTNKSLFTNRVLVKDGSTAVLAGLIRDSTNRTRNQPPVLGDVPLVGWLFRSKRDSRQKSNLVVLVTPHIVKESVDMNRLTLHKLNEYHDSNLEELFERGFFTRVKKKYDRRKHHRPTFEESAAITGRDTGSRKSSAFRRGDMKR